MTQRIEDYALIGNTLTAALVGKDGSIDWLCLPRFDGAACFAALVGTADNGCWRLAPAEPARRIQRRYRPGTLVLETQFDTASGRVLLTDCMTVENGCSHVLRTITGVQGTVSMRMRLIVRFDYGSIVPWVHKIDNGLRAIAGPDALELYTPVAMSGEGLTTVARFDVVSGDVVWFDLVYYASHKPTPQRIDATAACEGATSWWRGWSARMAPSSDRDAIVQRSLITLKALTYAPTGGIVASPTCSLPEQLGGIRNWDYRFCWLRDASLTLYAMLRAGFRQEAREWREWLVRVAAGRPQDLQILYGLRGERRLPESELPWLAGYAGSAPVRYGNAACTQFQLDVYGEVMETLHVAHDSGLESQERVWELQRVLLDFLESAWEKPDKSIWEMRGPPRHFTYSKVMAWVAFDRAIQAVERWGAAGRVENWKRCRTAIHEEVCRRAYHPLRRAFVQSYDSDRLDASLLKMCAVGFLPASDARMIDTVGAIERELMRDGFVLRYENAPEVDGLPAGEGVFLPCSFWLCDQLALMGEHERAQRLLDRLLGVRNDVGLLAEEYDTTQHRFLGNFPHVLSHQALINTALNLSTHAHPPSARH